MTKPDIEDRATNGLSLDGADVARVSRDKRSMTLRHSWDKADGRAQSGVMKAMRDAAQDLADETARNIELYTRSGWPDSDETSIPW